MKNDNNQSTTFLRCTQVEKWTLELIMLITRT